MRPRDLGDGLVLRRAAATDVDALAAFNAEVHREQDAEEPNPAMAVWTRDLLGGSHPTTTAADFALVEDRARGEVVSAMGLVSQIWSYGGVPLRVGQPELVGTRPAWRGRGLVRALFEEIHAWSVARGELVQAIDGVPWFYRQFGYEFALALRGGRAIALGDLPAPGIDPPADVRIRAATTADAPALARLDASGAGRYLVTCTRDASLWRYEIDAHDSRCIHRPEIRIVERHGAPVGYVAHSPRVLGGALWVLAWECPPDVTAIALADLRVCGERFAARGDPDGFREIGFWLGDAHPVYAALPASRPEPPYAWYLRVPDPAALIRALTPVFDRRLRPTDDGILRLGFYRDGLRLRIDAGRIAEVAAWRPPIDLPGVERFQPSPLPRASAAFPDLAFVQLLFGHRALADLERVFPDCLVRSDAVRGLLERLFPQCPSNVWALM
jgi:hypothetical protein